VEGDSASQYLRVRHRQLIFMLGYARIRLVSPFGLEHGRAAKADVLTPSCSWMGAAAGIRSNQPNRLNLTAYRWPIYSALGTN